MNFLGQNTYAYLNDMQSEHARELEELDRRIEFFVAHLAQSRLERQMATLGFDSGPIKCDSTYVENMCVAAIVEAQRVRAELIDRVSGNNKITVAKKIATKSEEESALI